MAKSNLNAATLLAPIPFGFKSYGHLKQFGTQLQAGLANLGFKNTKIFMQGSSVTGRSATKKTATGEALPFRPESDFDVALTGEDIFKQAEKLGLIKGGTRSGPIAVGSEQAKSLGIDDLLKTASEKVGRDVNVMIFKSAKEIKDKAPSVRVPTKNDGF